MGQPLADPKARRFLRIGSVSLVLGLLPQVFGLTFGLPPAALHFLTGLFLGVAIAANFAAFRRRCRPRLS